MTKETKLHKFGDNFTWSGVEPQLYKPPPDKKTNMNQRPSWAHVVRHVIIGQQGEATKFHVRYFEIGPGGYTSLEEHEHTHVVIGIRGQGRVIAGTERYELNFLDTLYIAPYTPHQLVNETNELFGFFCLVDAKRDRPQPLNNDEEVI